MDDKNMMQNLLLLEKGCCDLYLHGAVESSTKNVLGAFNSALDDSLSMQDEIYTGNVPTQIFESQQWNGCPGSNNLTYQTNCRLNFAKAQRIVLQCFQRCIIH